VLHFGTDCRRRKFGGPFAIESVCIACEWHGSDRRRSPGRSARSRAIAGSAESLRKASAISFAVRTVPQGPAATTARRSWRIAPHRVTGSSPTVTRSSSRQTPWCGSDAVEARSRDLALAPHSANDAGCAPSSRRDAGICARSTRREKTSDLNFHGAIEPGSLALLRWPARSGQRRSIVTSVRRKGLLERCSPFGASNTGSRPWEGSNHRQLSFG
jgi:hypothetical protein